MDRVIVTVRRADQPVGQDLEVPADLAASALARLIASALEWDSNGGREYQVEVPAIGVMLQGSESLKAAGVWDGASLILHPAGTPASGVQGGYRSPAVGSVGRPATGSGRNPAWKRLGD